jgi:dolichol-phosphate mannosyltransferase
MEGACWRKEERVKTLIVIPTYNERENIAPLIADVLRFAPGADLLVIDDGSPDGTGQLVDEIGASHPQVRAIHRAGKLGLGTAYVLGFHYAIEQGYDLVFEMDADYSHNPQYLPDFLALAEDADLVIGSRYIAGGDTPNWSPLRKVISGGGNLFARSVLGIPVKDCTAGYRCYRTAALRTLNLDAIDAQGYAFQVEMAYNFWKCGLRIRETPIVFEDRRVGKSKMSRAIFIEGFVWVLRARFTGDKAVRQAPASLQAAQEVAQEAAQEAAREAAREAAQEAAQEAAVEPLDPARTPQATNEVTGSRPNLPPSPALRGRRARYPTSATR